MPWCKLDATARYHFKFNRLASALGIRRAEARGLFLGLCSWAIIHAPDGRLDGFSEDEIEQAMDWEGRPGRCLKAMIEVGLLDKSELNKRLESRKQTPEFSILKDYRSSWIYEIHGYFENSGTFRESEKKRKQREISNFVPGQSGDTERVLSRDCPPREEKRRERRERTRARAGHHQRKNSRQHPGAKTRSSLPRGYALQRSQSDSQAEPGGPRSSWRTLPYDQRTNVGAREFFSRP